MRPFAKPIASKFILSTNWLKLRDWGDIIKYIGYIEATFTFPLESQTFEIETLLLVLPSTDYQQRVPIAIGTTITDMVVDFINKTNPDNLSKSWKAVCCATQSKWLVQAQPENKFLVRTTKPVTLPPFSTTTIRGSTKLRSHGTRLNLMLNLLIVHNFQLLYNVPLPTAPWNRVAVGLKNISARAIPIPSKVVVGRLQQAKMIPDDQSPKPKKSPLGGKGFLDFRPTKFGGIEFLDRGTAAMSQGFTG